MPHPILAIVQYNLLKPGKWRVRANPKHEWANLLDVKPYLNFCHNGGDAASLPYSSLLLGMLTRMDEEFIEDEGRKNADFPIV